MTARPEPTNRTIRCRPAVPSPTPGPYPSGPGPGDPSTILWAYHSHTHEWRDVNAGLIGPIIIGRRGAFGPDGTPHDVDREFVTLFGVFDENESRYTPDNLRTYTGDTLRTNDRGQILFPPAGMTTINGLTFGTLPVESLTMRLGERVRWYLFGATTANDFHSPHWHGGTVLIDQKRTDLVNLAVPLMMVTADMVADAPGIWMFHCHVAEHMASGMTSRFQILDEAPSTP